MSKPFGVLGKDFSIENVFFLFVVVLEPRQKPREKGTSLRDIIMTLSFRIEGSFYLLMLHSVS